MEKETNPLGNDNQMHQHSGKNCNTSNETKKSEKDTYLPSKTNHSFGSNPFESIENSPKKLLGKWHKTVRIGSGTKTFLNKWKSHSTTIDRSMENNKDPLVHDEMGKGAASDDDNGKNSTWSEHVWSTFIHRGYSDDVTEKKPLVLGKDLLTDFQQDKFKYFFYHVLDLNTDHVISSWNC